MVGDRFEDLIFIIMIVQNLVGIDVFEGDQDSNGGFGVMSGSGDCNRLVIIFNFDSFLEQRIINFSFDFSFVLLIIVWIMSNILIVIEEVIWQGLESFDSDEYSSIDEVSLIGCDG